MRKKSTNKDDEIVTCTGGHPIMIWKCVHGNIIKMRCCDKHLESHRKNDHGMFTPCKECDHDMVRHSPIAGAETSIRQS